MDNQRNSTWANSTLFGGSVQSWSNLTCSITNTTAPTAYNTLYVPLTSVSGGTVVQFDFAWNNSSYQNSTGGIVYDGNQLELVVGYGAASGTSYVSTIPAAGEFLDIYSAPFQNIAKTNVSNAPGPVNVNPTSGSNAAQADGMAVANGATLLSVTAVSGSTYAASNGSTMPRPSNVATGASNWVTVRLQLPANVPQSGNLIFGVRRTENGTNDGNADDFYIRNVTVADTSLCIIKSTPAGAGGAFNFTTANLDDNLVSVGNQSTFTLTTSGATPAVLDTNASATGNQPALYAAASTSVSANPVTIQETLLPVGYAMTRVTCDQGVTGSISSNTAVLSTLPGGVMTSCTLINRPPTIALVKQVSGNRLLPGDQWTVQIRNSGGTALASGATSGTATTATTGAFVATAGTAYTLAEVASDIPNFAVYARNMVCTNSTTGSATILPSGAGTLNLATGTATWPAITPAAGDTITCTLTNTGVATVGANIVLRKQISGRHANMDQFTVQIQQPAGTTISTGGATTGTGTTANTNPVLGTAGTAYTLTEVGANGASLANYNTTINCSASITAAGTALPSGLGTSFSVVPQNGDSIDCTLSNASKPIVTSTKRASANPLLIGASGQSYAIAVTIANGPTTVPITIADTLPTGITISGTVTTSGGTLSGCANSGSSLGASCQLSTGLANGTYTITVPVNVAAAAVGASGGNNTANLSGGGDPSCTSATGEACDPSTPPIAVNVPPNVIVTKAFSPNPIAGGGTSTLTITIENSAAGSVLLTGMALTDNLPSGMTVASSQAASTSCNTAGSATASATPGGASVSLSNGSVGANSSCTITVPVTAP